MNTDNLKQSFTNQGKWQESETNIFGDVNFDFVLVKRTGINIVHHLCAIYLSLIDAKSAMVWKENYEVIKKNTKGNFFKSGAIFAMCLIAENITADGLMILKSDNFGLRPALSVVSGGCYGIIIADQDSSLILAYSASMPVVIPREVEDIKKVVANWLVS